MGDQVLRLLRKRGAGADEVVGFAGVGDEVVGLDGLREVVDGDHLPAVGAYAMGSLSALLDPAQQLNRPRLLVVIEKKCLMFQPANQVVASAILYKPRLPHVEQCITKPITISTLLCQ